MLAVLSLALAIDLQLFDKSATPKQSWTTSKQEQPCQQKPKGWLSSVWDNFKKSFAEPDGQELGKELGKESEERLVKRPPSFRWTVFLGFGALCYGAYCCSDKLGGCASVVIFGLLGLAYVAFKSLWQKG